VDDDGGVLYLVVSGAPAPEGTGSPVPAADAVLACPLTFNSVHKFAHGNADNFAIGLLCEMVGYDVPVVVVPHCKPQLASHPAFAASLETLRVMGVRVLLTRTRRTSAGCRRGTRSSTRSRSGLVPDDAVRPRDRRAADRAGQAVQREEFRAGYCGLPEWIDRWMNR
jgi:hypothetical protein